MAVGTNPPQVFKIVKGRFVSGWAPDSRAGCLPKNTMKRKRLALLAPATLSHNQVGGVRIWLRELRLAGETT